ncbi:hypothetical protein Anas_10168 [Armadillidium nasatum]|uniref:Uncharacterized protein n=1 Tax=Armadillidium nasatum TaxID=96803 RepID=A0A5N5TE20_9CRUS|nr:hypothetical protein Anas_10168 [Armadillidium nasatum]
MDYKLKKKKGINLPKPIFLNFQPPNPQLIEKIHPLPPFEEVLVFREAKAEVNNKCWVYKTEDKISQSLYPLGFENHPQGNDPANRLPVRHSSFLSPRYARVRHRPQRAHSFGTSRYPFGLHGDKISLRPLPVSIPRLHDISLKDVNFSVIEVGSLKSLSPENSLHFPCNEFSNRCESRKFSITIQKSYSSSTFKGRREPTRKWSSKIKLVS